MVYKQGQRLYTLRRVDGVTRGPSGNSPVRSVGSSRKKDVIKPYGGTLVKGILRLLKKDIFRGWFDSRRLLTGIGRDSGRQDCIAERGFILPPFLSLFFRLFSLFLF